MAQDIFGGVEGGASVSSIVLLDSNGKCLAEAFGPGTNFWTIGMVETRNRIVTLVENALKKANLPTNTKLKCLCLSLSGIAEESSTEELERGFFENYPGLCDQYVLCSDTMGPLATVKEGGGVVLIAGTGSNALVINPDGTQFSCGGWGYMLGDEGSAYWISHKALKIYFNHADRLETVPYGYDTDILWETIKTFFGIKNRLQLLPHLYKNFDKSKFAQLCKVLSEKAREGDLLCKWIFEKAGEELAKYLTALSHNIVPELLEAEGGLAVVCVGSVWKSWDLLRTGFMNQFQQDSGKITQFSLLVLQRSAAIGAAYMAANAACCNVHKDYENNYKTFHHHKKV
ncbi:N-acetyl-D-glucosamine kinase [Cimex lectularius]|uniref:N-acetyl-D-glucosamine kinase n=1 Tax=Cimex lectularius TaxID=79782 RepID=A0A8I6R9T3_CIMLE|nr:N-acetyl-D-glucosamine kinase [Cimex lectularius]